MNKRWYFVPLFWMALANCGVKPHESSPTEKVSPARDLPAGMLWTKNQVSLVHVFPLAMVAGEENRITYRFVDQRLIGLGPEYSFQASYSMPEMPMAGYPKTVGDSLKNPGEAAFIFEILHEGVWQITLSILKAGNLIDTLTYQVDVPKE